MRTIEHQPSEDAVINSYIAMAASAFVMACLGGGLLSGAHLINIDALENLPAWQGALLFAAGMLPGLVVTWLIRRRVGAVRFTRGVAVTGFILLGGVGLLMLSHSNKPDELAKGGTLLFIAFWLFGAFGYGWRTLAGLVALGGVAWALVFYFSVHDANRAGIGGATALFGGAAYWLLSTDLPALGRRSLWQFSDHWQTEARGKLIKSVALIMVFIALGAFVHHDHDARPPMLAPIVGVIGYTVAFGCGIFGVLGLFGFAFGMLGSLVPKPGSNFEGVANQKVYGDAGYAEVTIIAAALRDHDTGGHAPPRFRD